jgi:hypothetical protein
MVVLTGGSGPIACGGSIPCCLADTQARFYHSFPDWDQQTILISIARTNNWSDPKDARIVQPFEL